MPLNQRIDKLKLSLQLSMASNYSDAIIHIIHI